MSLRYALLGLLNDRQASGYELTQRFNAGIGKYAWSAKHSQIYPELRKLEEAELVEVVETGTRGKRIYALTETGRHELRSWLHSEWGQGTVRNEFLLRLFLLSALEPDERVRVLHGVRDYAAARLAEVNAILEWFADPEFDESVGAYAAKYGQFSLEAMRSWADWAITEQGDGSSD